MGRAPCCDKANVKKGPWSPEEDAKLKAYIEQHGTGGNWIALPQKIGLKRCGKSCRLRWLNYLRPNIKHGGFSEEEDNIICSLYISIGSRWSIIAAQLPGRTDNDIKNYWNTRLKKKFLGKQRKEKGRKGANCLKSRNANHSMVSSSNHNNNNNNNSQTSYWPELPVLAPIPFSNQQHSFNDHASIRKLLIKLGGRFSNDDNQLIHNTTSPQLFPTDYPISNNQPLYDQCINNIPSSASMEGVLNYNTVFGHHEFNEDGAVDLLTFQGQNIYVPAGFEEMVSNNGEQKLDGLEFLGEDMVNNLMSSATNEGTIINHCLDEMSSLVYPPQTDPNCSHDQGMQQRLMLQECDFVDEMGYQGLV